MPKLPRLDAGRSRTCPAQCRFELLRSKGSHRIYGKGALRVTVPFHSGVSLHPKIIKQVREIIEEAGQSTVA